jgi:hypothetical protein
MEESDIEARVVARMHSKGHYESNPVPIQAAASFGVPTHDRGRAKQLIEELAHDDAAPVKFKGRSAVALEHGSEGWVASFIRQRDPDALPWDLE